MGEGGRGARVSEFFIFSQSPNLQKKCFGQGGWGAEEVNFFCKETKSKFFIIWRGGGRGAGGEREREKGGGGSGRLE